jgi:hypothetical protein
MGVTAALYLRPQGFLNMKRLLDDIDRSLIRHQVEMGVAVRMACLEILTRNLGNGPPPLSSPRAEGG